MVALFFAAFSMGLMFNAAPGAVFAETVRHGLHGGFKSALAVQFGSLVGDALWAVLGLVGVGVLLQLEALRWPIGLAGVAYLVWLACDSWRAARTKLELQPAAARTTRALRSGVLLSVSNPQNVAFWAALGSALGALGVQEPQPHHYAVFFGGFMTSSVAWCFVCAAAVDLAFRRAGGRWSALIYRACAVGFLVLAVASFRSLVQGRGVVDSDRPSTTTRMREAGLHVLEPAGPGTVLDGGR